MKRIPVYLFFPLLILLHSCNRPDTTFTKRFPDVMTVAGLVDKGYSIYSNSAFYYSLAKKQDGWYVTQVSYETGKVTRSELFWSAKDRKYLVLPLDFWKNKNEPGSATESLTQLLYTNSAAYDRSVYFGYDGWEDDVVTALENISDPDDTLLEGLARAYEQQAEDICEPDAAGAANHLADLTDAQAKDVTALFDKEIEACSRIAAHDPDYSTPSGLIKTKLANTHMFAWSELIHRGRQTEAAKYLEKNLYDPLLVNFAKNELMCADSNSILVTDGDADTYSAWYVQQALGYRKDVLVINLSLLGLPDWIFYWKKQGAFELGMPEEFYRDKNRDYFYVNGNQDQNSTASMYTSHAKPSTHTLIDMRTAIASHDTAWFSASNGHISIPFHQLQLTWLANDTVSGKATFPSSYLYRSQLVLLDLIASNYPARKIYFSTTVSNPQIAMLEEGLRSEGLLVSYHPELGTTDSYNHVRQDLPSIVKNLQRYNYEPGDLQHLQVPTLYSSYFYQYCTLADLYISRNDSNSAVAALDSCVANLSSDIKDPDPLLFVGMDYIRAGNKDKGSICLGKMITKMKAYDSEPVHHNDIARHMNSLDFLIDLCGKNHLPDLEKKLADLKLQLEALKK